MPALSIIANECRSYVCEQPLLAMDFVRWLATRPALWGWDRRDVYQACLGRLPELETGLIEWSYDSRYERAAHIAACLTCTEFRTNFADIVTRALPDARRIFFVHIPRTAGTSVQMLFERTDAGAVWHDSYADDVWFARKLATVDTDALAFMVRLLAQLADPSSPLLLLGHVPISVLLSRGLIRAGDEVFTLVRAPDEIVRSNVSYIVDRVTSTSQAPDASDWRLWLAEIGCALDSSNQVSASGVRAIIRSERFAREYANPLTRYLSIDDRPETVPGVLNLVNGQALTIRTLPDFLSVKFGTTAALPMENRSESGAHGLLADDDLRFIRSELCGKDGRLWAHYDEDTGSFEPFDVNKVDSVRKGEVTRQLMLANIRSRSSRSRKTSP